VTTNAAHEIARKLNGDVWWAKQEEWQTREACPGAYAGDRRYPKPKTAPTQIECPYCHRCLERVLSQAHRVLWVSAPSPSGDKLCVSEKPPKTYDVVICRDCRQAFTTLKGGAK